MAGRTGERWAFGEDWKGEVRWRAFCTWGGLGREVGVGVAGLGWECAGLEW